MYNHHVKNRTRANGAKKKEIGTRGTGAHIYMKTSGREIDGTDPLATIMLVLASVHPKRLGKRPLGPPVAPVSPGNKNAKGKTKGGNKNETDIPQVRQAKWAM